MRKSHVTGYCRIYRSPLCAATTAPAFVAGTGGPNAHAVAPGARRRHSSEPAAGGATVLNWTSVMGGLRAAFFHGRFISLSRSQGQTSLIASAIPRHAPSCHLSGCFSAQFLNAWIMAPYET